jgi:hypothetical protein
MSFWVYLENDKEAVIVERHDESGTYVLGGTTEAERYMLITPVRDYETNHLLWIVYEHGRLGTPVCILTDSEVTQLIKDRCRLFKCPIPEDDELTPKKKIEPKSLGDFTDEDWDRALVAFNKLFLTVDEFAQALSSTTDEE